ncbi:sulfatase-like hydrolase/transferase [Flammeovirga agarivorans]|uniref:Sulfatase-like hydrolase/transferase n=1 Tax=Flammeovirga agarivorans TaxID=2726742 RepID=A0A7X8XY77_9BACT|nr:sulfatase-like hydrolase/transferase [Flammeovirga agarivorans]NLR93964.1 sulfatase-like hydrolase/transferase [Flammeovirga agarivorans]
MKFIKLHLLLLLGLTFFSSCTSSKNNFVEDTSNKKKPNVVIIFLDDSGYADFNPFNDDKNAVATPHVDQLSQEGVKLTNFYVPQAVCSASRAALLTGSYPGRTKVFAAHKAKERGLDTQFPTMGELFEKSGYKTALFGKWHCGDQEDTRPHNRGFQETAGLMYSNDMWKYHPVAPEVWGKNPLQYWENGKVTINDITKDDQKQLTKWYTEKAVDFINRNNEDPFLLYVTHSMPHAPIYCSDEFDGKSGKGLYADVTLELDWSVGQITKALKENGLDENTIVIFSSDNGPWSIFGNHAGKTPFREAKATSFDGGTKSATIIKYPNGLKAGAFDKAICSIDLLPTLANLCDVSLGETEIDGKDIWPYLSGDEKDNPHPYYAFSTGAQLEVIMSADGKWKLHLPHKYRKVKKYGKDGGYGKYTREKIELSLFDLENDPYEKVNVADKHPEVVKELQAFAEAHKKKFYSKVTL